VPQGEGRKGDETRLISFLVALFSYMEMNYIVWLQPNLGDISKEN
jgi:hypothetical protein